MWKKDAWGLRVSRALKGRVHRPLGSQSGLCSPECLWLRRGFVIPVRPGCAWLLQHSPDQLNETTCHINLTNYCTTRYPSVGIVAQTPLLKDLSFLKKRSRERAGVRVSASGTAHLQGEQHICRESRAELCSPRWLCCLVSCSPCRLTHVLDGP